MNKETRTINIICIAIIGLSIVILISYLAVNSKFTNITAASTQMQPDGIRLNINKASQEELMTLPDIGETLAKRIIEYREKNGVFKTIDEITEVEGIGEKKLDKLRDQIKVSN